MTRATKIFTAALLLAATANVYGQQCASGQIHTRDAYLYGRFETRMQSLQGDGVVSAFFLYNLDVGCNWPAENNEIDIEMTGNHDDSVQFTTHYPGPSSFTQIVPTVFNPHGGMHDYAFEWEPGIVRWFIDGNLAYTQDQPYVSGLIYPMRILMNLWAADAPGWTGVWDPAVMPGNSSYDYVRYYAYTPGSGDAGTNNNFTLGWSDDFESIDEDRWEASEFGGFGGNFCTFVGPNVNATGGQLQLSITEPLATTTSPVHFSVDVNSLDIGPSDTIYLNGGFNGWCGSCNPMSDPDGDGVWELTLVLPAGEYEFLYTKNGWSEIGGAPLGSSCDFKPCDEWANYGVTVPYDSGPVETDTFCWGTCDYCGGIDTDSDGVNDDTDNCLLTGNPEQIDSDGDGHGNLCDADLNQDCIVNPVDLGIFRARFFSTDADADLNGDGIVNPTDLGIFKSLFFSAPGPSPAGALCD